MIWLNKLRCALAKKGHKYSIHTHRCLCCDLLDRKYAHLYDEE